MITAIRKDSQVSMTKLLQKLDKPLIDKILSKNNVIEYIIQNGKDREIAAFLTNRF